MKEEQKPGWLQTLWNVNPRLAAEAESELIILYAIKEKAREITEFLKSMNKL